MATAKGRLRAGKAGLIVMAMAFSAGCGGPATVDPGPTQSVEYYFSGTEDSGALHVHVHWVQSKHNITLLSPCVPSDTCNITAYSAKGFEELDISTPLPVALSSGSGTFADPGITFTITTTNGKTFTYAGTVATSGSQVQMIGTFSGATHPASRLVLDKTAF
jgi:hypothetical protein